MIKLLNIYTYQEFKEKKSPGFSEFLIAAIYLPGLDNFGPLVQLWCMSNHVLFQFSGSIQMIEISSGKSCSSTRLLPGHLITERPFVDERSYNNLRSKGMTSRVLFGVLYMYTCIQIHIVILISMDGKLMHVGLQSIVTIAYEYELQTA